MESVKFDTLALDEDAQIKTMQTQFSEQAEDTLQVESVASQREAEEKPQEETYTSISAESSIQDTPSEEDAQESSEASLIEIDSQSEHSVETKPLERDNKSIDEKDLFIFNVVAKDDQLLYGHALLQFFLTSGFRFGEMSLFHRHQHSDGTGPVLFSIANMMLPGTFDPINMKQFDCPGVSFFLSAPDPDINVKEAFDLMLIAVEQMAEEFDCLVLNAQREKLTEAEFRNYHERLAHYL